jgi:predicted DNA-binding protein
MITLNLGNELENKLQFLTQEQGKTLDQLLKEIVFNYLENSHDAAMDELMRGEDTLL